MCDNAQVWKVNPPDAGDDIDAWRDVLRDNFGCLAGEVFWKSGAKYLRRRQMHDQETQVRREIDYFKPFTIQRPSRRSKTPLAASENDLNVRLLVLSSVIPIRQQ